MADNNKPKETNTEEHKCPMDCKKCLPQQNLYCAAQIALANNELLKKGQKRLDAVEAEVDEALSRLETLENTIKSLQTEHLIDPMAQEGSGADTIDSPDNKKK